MVARVVSLGLMWAATVVTGAAVEPSVDNLAWLAGCWRGTMDGVVMEEIWMAPAGGVMLGLHRDRSPDGSVFFEYLRIVATEGRIDYIASPSGRGETDFRLVEMGQTRVVFENFEHDFPKRIIYWLDSSTLNARIDGGKGIPGGREWIWLRVECP